MKFFVRMEKEGNSSRESLRIMKKNYGMMIDAFQLLCSVDAKKLKGSFQINGNLFLDWVEKDLKVLDNKYLKKVDLIANFQLVNYDEDATEENLNMNTLLVRYEFVELLVRLAISK